MTIGQRIKALRLQAGITVDELAEKLDKNRATIYRYESNEIEKLPTTVLEPLAKALNTTPAYLMGWGDDEETKEALPDERSATVEIVKNMSESEFDRLNTVIKAMYPDKFDK